jgi:hypothetical protein
MELTEAWGLIAKEHLWPRLHLQRSTSEVFSFRSHFWGLQWDLSKSRMSAGDKCYSRSCELGSYFFAYLLEGIEFLKFFFLFVFLAVCGIIT